ncbi:hypothetical protein D3C78_531340 [compost metagenome]
MLRRCVQKIEGRTCLFFLNSVEDIQFRHDVVLTQPTALELGFDHSLDVRDDLLHADRVVSRKHLFVDVGVDDLVQRFAVRVERLHGFLDVAHFWRRQTHQQTVDEVIQERVDLCSFITGEPGVALDVVRDVLLVVGDQLTHVFQEDTAVQDVSSSEVGEERLELLLVHDDTFQQHQVVLHHRGSEVGLVDTFHDFRRQAEHLDVTTTHGLFELRVDRLVSPVTLVDVELGFRITGVTRHHHVDTMVLDLVSQTQRVRGTDDATESLTVDLGVLGEHELHRGYRIFVFRVQLDLDGLTTDRVVQRSQGVGQHDRGADSTQDLTVFQDRLTDTEFVVVECDVGHQFSRYEQHDGLLTFHVAGEHDAVDVFGLTQFIIARQSTRTQTSQQITFDGFAVRLTQLIDDLVVEITHSFKATSGLLDDLGGVTVDVVHLRLDVVIVRRLISHVDGVAVDVQHDVVTDVFCRVTWHVNRDHRLGRQVHDQRVTVGFGPSLGMGHDRLYRNVLVATFLVHRTLNRR